VAVAYTLGFFHAKGNITITKRYSKEEEANIKAEQLKEEEKQAELQKEANEQMKAIQEEIQTIAKGGDY